MVGERLGRYLILDRIGAGGMGQVFRARDERLQRDVALKLLPEGALSDPEARTRFRREALLLSKLNHPNIETIHDFDSHEGMDFLVMEHLSGSNLHDRIATDGALPESEVLRLGLQLAEGLAAAHAKHIVHGDLKPANLQITPEGQLKILDFGVAHLLESETATTVTTLDTEPAAEGTSGAIAGTLPYMAPEQLRGQRGDTRSDTYTAGAVLYEMATGKRAFPGSGKSLLESILSRPPTSPRTSSSDVSAALEAVLLKALEKDPDQRFQSATELRDALQRLESQRLRSPRAVRSTAFVVGAIGLVAVAAFVFKDWVRHNIVSIVLPARVEALAVLPLENLSRDPEQEYFVDGVTDLLINNLAEIGALKVISRRSVMQYKNTQIPLKDIARALDVDVLVSGSVRRLGDRVRVTTQLIDARTDRQLWGEEFEREVKDIMKMEADLAHTIANEIHVEISPEARERAANVGSVDPEAIDAYWRGRAEQDKFTEEGFARALELYHQALEIAPDYAPAYAAVAATYIDMVGPRLPAKEAMPRAKAAAQQALRLDPGLPEALSSMAYVRAYWDWDWKAAEKDFARALQNRPNAARIHLDEGMYLIAVGRFEAALEAMKRAQELDPFSHTVRTITPWPLYFLRRYDELIESSRSIIQMGDSLDPGPYFAMGIAHAEKNEFVEAIASFEHAARLDPAAHILSMLGYTHAVAGDTTRAMEVLARLDEVPVVEDALRALVYTGLGDHDTALALLERSYAEREHTLVFFIWNPCFDALREDPRFQDLQRRMGLTRP